MRVTEKFVFFWGKDDIYSNFYYSAFRHQGIVFKWSEQAIMYRKAKLFGAHDICRKIMRASTPKECRDLGRSRDIPFDNDIWDKNKMRIYEEVLMDKFSNPQLKSKLLKTGNRIIAEASPFDKIWGIGLREDNPRAEDVNQWRGQNLLGEVLMRVRNNYNRKIRKEK